MLAANEVIANEIVKLARKRNITIYNAVNEILSQALKAESGGYSLTELVEKYQTLDRAYKIGLGLRIESLYDDLVELLFQIEPDKLMSLFREKGYWYGKYFLTNSEPLKCFIEVMEYSTLSKAEVSLSKQKDTLVFMLIGSTYSIPQLDVYSVFVQEVMGVLGYQREIIELKKGILKIKFINSHSVTTEDNARVDNANNKKKQSTTFS